MLKKAFSFTSLKWLYQNSPQSLKKAYSSIPFRWRAGSVYRATQRLIEATEYLGPESLRALQNSSLRKLLLHCQRKVPWYQQKFPNIAALSDQELELFFTSLPLLEKSTLRDHAQAMTARSCGEPTYRDNTGGSSGTPLEFFKNNSMYPQELAYMHSQWRRVGYLPHHRKLALRGRTFVNLAADQRWAVNPIYNELTLSTYHLDAETLKASLPMVQRFAPQYLHGYPSAIVTYLEVLLASDLPLPSGIRAVFCGSEPLYPHQRVFIEKTLDCRCYSWYGQSECVLLAGECEHSQDYHSFPLYGILELVDANGKVIDQPHMEGEIVATSLHNYAMPFIRYRTGDRGILAAGDCPCRRNFPRLQRVSGRLQHFVYTQNRVKVPVTAFVFGQHFTAFRSVASMQLVQNEPGRLSVRLIPHHEFSLADEQELIGKMQDSVDRQLVVSVEYVKELPRNQAGKVDFVVQNVAPDRQSLAL